MSKQTAAPPESLLRLWQQRGKQWSARSVTCVSLLKQQLDCTPSVSDSLVLQADQDSLFSFFFFFFFLLSGAPGQPMSLGSRGRSGSSPPRAPDRGLRSLMMDEHCPLAGFTSDQRQTTADACCTATPPSAPLSWAPPTLHSETAAGMKPSRHRWENPAWSVRSEGKMRCGWRELFLFSASSPLLFLYLRRQNTTPLKDVRCPSVFLTRHYPQRSYSSEHLKFLNGWVAIQNWVEELFWLARSNSSSPVFLTCRLHVWTSYFMLSRPQYQMLVYECLVSIYESINLPPIGGRRL